jgi:hypothetical protein
MGIVFRSTYPPTSESLVLQLIMLSLFIAMTCLFAVCATVRAYYRRDIDTDHTTIEGMASSDLIFQRDQKWYGEKEAYERLRARHPELFAEA